MAHWVHFLCSVTKQGVDTQDPGLRCRAIGSLQLWVPLAAHNILLLPRSDFPLEQSHREDASSGLSALHGTWDRLASRPRLWEAL